MLAASASGREPTSQSNLVASALCSRRSDSNYDNKADSVCLFASINQPNEHLAAPHLTRCQRKAIVHPNERSGSGE